MGSPDTRIVTALAREVEEAARGARGGAVILSENPIHDTGGGQRSAQLALELLERGWCVVFVSRGRVTETVELGLVYEQERLVRVDLREILAASPEAVLAPLLGLPEALVVTQVAVEAWLPVIDAAKRSGAVTLYDCVDRWASELGRGWYRRSAERTVARSCDALVASAPELVQHVELLGGREVRLVPNAFNHRVFDPSRSWPRPADLPSGRIVLFVGALWGKWFDWDLVAAAAAAQPDDRFVFVGDRRREGASLPGNCVFLGLKPQAEVPPYQAHAEVAILPWRVDVMTHSMSPLTIYEHVSMGLPVVAPPTEPLRGIPGIVTADGREAFVEAVRSRGRSTLDPATVQAMADFAAANSWVARVDRILEISREARTADGERGGAPHVRTGAMLSVVIPSYNHEAFIAAAVDSVRDQTLPTGELLVVDDGSSDGSLEVLAEHAFPGMRCLPQSNRGAHAAINRGIALSRGDYVAILNSDDVFRPERLEHAWAAARASGAALLFGTVELIDDDGRPLAADHEVAAWYRRTCEEAVRARTVREAVREHNVAMTTSNFFVHRELWTRLGGFAGWRYVHDYDFLLRALALCPERVVHAPELCDVRYRIHGRNTIAENVERALDERDAMRGRLHAPLRVLGDALRRPKRERAISRAVERTPLLAPVAHRSSAPDSPLRVGVVARSLDAGGLEELVGLLAQSLRARGHDVSVLCTHAGGSVADRLRGAGLDVTSADGDAPSWSRWQQRTRPDVVSTHYAPLEVVETLSGGAPIVETIHNTYAWHTRADWHREAAKDRLLTATVAVSETAERYHVAHVEAARAEARGAAPEADVDRRLPVRRVVPNAVHPGRAARIPRTLARRLSDLPPDSVVFVHLGRITAQKNLERLVTAFSRIADRQPDSLLVLAGPADDRGALARLRDAAPDLFRSGRVRHLPTVEAVGTLLSAADAFVSSSFFEGWSVAASEALWVGIPVVLTECGGARALVGPDGARGIVVPSPLGDPLAASPEVLAHPPVAAVEAATEALAEALARIGAERAAWAARATAIRAHARSALSPERLADDYVRVFREAVAVATG